MMVKIHPGSHDCRQSATNTYRIPYARGMSTTASLTNSYPADECCNAMLRECTKHCIS
jgi:hypothetical protein